MIFPHEPDEGGFGRGHPRSGGGSGDSFGGLR